MQTKARDDQVIVKNLIPLSPVGAQHIYLGKKVIDFGMTKNPWWPVNFLHWVGLRLFQLHAHKNLALGGLYLLLSHRFFCGNLFHFTSWNTQSTLRDKNLYSEKNTQLKWTMVRFFLINRCFDRSGHYQQCTYIANIANTCQHIANTVKCTYIATMAKI